MKYNFDKIEKALKETLTEEELRSLLDPLKVLASQRTYGLAWEEPDNGAYDQEIAEKDLIKSFPFLEEVAEKAVLKDPGGKTNMLIEGDNLHALQSLQYTHKGLVDVIYIDPPYNTGNRDFVYNDKYVDAEDSWRHSSWLSFMNKRLKLARELMSEEGVIFISIDDNEMAQLKLLCDQVFGEENHLMTTTRKTKTMTGDKSTGLNIQHDFILAYSKDKRSALLKGEKKDLTNYKNPDKDKNGAWINGNPSARSGGTGTYFPITNPYTNKVDYPPTGRYWAFNKDTFEKYVKSGRIVFRKKHTENQRGFTFKQYAKTMANTHNPFHSLTFGNNDFLNENGTKDLIAIIGQASFDYPKPLALIKKIVESHPNPNAIVLDFFAGSGTTGHAVLELNKEDGGKRQFILCTNNEVNRDIEIDKLVELGHIDAFAGRKRTKAHKEWTTSLQAFKETDTYLKFLESDDYKDLGIARAITQQRIQKVIEGYTTPKGKHVEGIHGNLRYFTVALKEDQLYPELNEEALIEETVDLIRIKEGLFDNVIRKEVEGAPICILEDDASKVVIVLDYHVMDYQIDAILEEFSEKDTRTHKFYTSYPSYNYKGITHEPLPKEILNAIKMTLLEK